MCSACERGQGEYCKRKSEAVELIMASKHGKRTTKRAAGQSKKYDEEFPVTVPANGWRGTLKRKATSLVTINYHYFSYLLLSSTYLANLTHQNTAAGNQ